MRGKKAKLHKSMLKERNNKNIPPPSVTTSTPAPGDSLFSTLTQTMGQGIFFGAGSGVGHRVIDGISGLWSSTETTPSQQDTPNVSKDPTYNECDDFKKKFVTCMHNNDQCNEIHSQYLGCLDKLNEHTKQ